MIHFRVVGTLLCGEHTHFTIPPLTKSQDSQNWKFLKISTIYDYKVDKHVYLNNNIIYFMTAVVQQNIIVSVTLRPFLIIVWTSVIPQRLF